MRRQLVIESILSCCFTLIIFIGNSQDLMSELKENIPTDNYTLSPFMGTRLINFHTTETLPKHSLEVRISHRFAPVSTGSSNFWGLDGPASIQLRIDYAISNRMTIGIGRSSEHKIVDGFVKYKFSGQTTDNRSPVSMVALLSANVNSEPNNLQTDRFQDFDDRVAFIAMVMISRKFNSKFSLQLSPAIIHYNWVANNISSNDIYSVIGSARYKITKSTALVFEYCQSLTNHLSGQTIYKDLIGFGFDMDTGGHVFQMFLTNGYAINETYIIPYTSSDISMLSLGFNISRVFSPRQRK